MVVKRLLIVLAVIGAAGFILYQTAVMFYEAGVLNTQKEAAQNRPVIFVTVRGENMLISEGESFFVERGSLVEYYVLYGEGNRNYKFSWVTGEQEVERGVSSGKFQVGEALQTHIEVRLD